MIFNISYTNLITTQIMIIQVPLKQKTPQPMYYPESFGAGGCVDDLELAYLKCPSSATSCCIPESESLSRHRIVPDKKEAADVEEAIISVGESEGKFKEIDNIAIERDERYPIRVTLQFYKSTANGVVDDAIVKKISTQIAKARDQGDFVGSLVVGGDTGRPTEHRPEPPQPKRITTILPPWWDTLWATYGNTFPRLTEKDARVVVCAGGSFDNTTMNESKDEVLGILRRHCSDNTVDWPIAW